MNNSQQPEVIACQGEGEMFKTYLTHNQIRAVNEWRCSHETPLLTPNHNKTKVGDGN